MCIRDSNYDINNITENQTITVVATPVTYTVHYVDAKGSGTQTVVYGPNNQTYDTETGAITLTTVSYTHLWKCHVFPRFGHSALD